MIFYVLRNQIDKIIVNSLITQLLHVRTFCYYYNYNLFGFCEIHIIRYTRIVLCSQFVHEIELPLIHKATSQWSLILRQYNKWKKTSSNDIFKNRGLSAWLSGVSLVNFQVWKGSIFLCIKKYILLLRGH